MIDVTAEVEEVLAEACPACAGVPRRVRECETCGGRGAVPTAVGRQVAMLVAASAGENEGRDSR